MTDSSSRVTRGGRPGSREDWQMLNYENKGITVGYEDFYILKYITYYI